MPEPQVTRAGIYCRLSYSPDGSLEKVDRQEDDCRRLAERLVWPVDDRHVYTDNSRSAWQRNRKRPGWDALLAAIEKREIDAIIVYHGDRLIRQPYDLETLINIANQRAIRIASVSGTRNLDNADDRYILRIEAAQACRQSDDTSRRVLRSLEAKAAKGVPHKGGRRTFGFESDNITHRTAEVELLREAATRLLAGQSLNAVVRWLDEASGGTTTSGTWTAGRVRQWASRGDDEVADDVRRRLTQDEPAAVARDLNMAGVVCPVRAEWTPRVLKSLLRSPRMVGLMDVGGVLVLGAWKPILDRDIWEAVGALLDGNAEQHPYRGAERRYLLSQWARCVTCAGLLRVASSHHRGDLNRRRTYACKNPDCPRPVSRSVAHLETYVENRVLHRLQDPALLDQVLTAAPPEVGTELAALEARKAQALAQFEALADHPELSPELIAKSVASFTRRINELRARQAATVRQSLLARYAGISREQWQATPMDVRAAIVRALYRVIILPATWRGPGFDPACVRLEPVEE